MYQNIRKKLNSFLNFCINLFGEERGKIVHDFYRDTLLSPTKTTGSKLGTITDRRIKNIEYILDHFSEEIFFEVINDFSEKKKSGTLASRQINYFQKTIENKFNGPSKSRTYTKPLITLTDKKQSITPTKFKKVRTEYENEWLNWDYKCSCGEILDPWKKNCTKCNTKINWRSLAS